MADRWRYLAALLCGVPIGGLYAVLARLVLGAPATRDVLGTLTVGFVFLVPVVIGVLTVQLAPPEARRRWSFALLMPWVSTGLGLALIGALNLEVVLCLALLAPAFLVMSSLGGLAAALATRWAGRRGGPPGHLLALVALAPGLATPLEHRFPEAAETRVVESRRAVRAEPAVVWWWLTHFDRIEPAEQRPSLFNLVGLPRPVGATLMDPRLGGLRRGSYENGLAFVEQVTDWQPERSFGFTIRVDPAASPPPPFDAIGGPRFAPLAARYTLEPLAGGGVLLRLSSTHRLMTRFNGYGGYWTDALLADLQDYLLRIVQERAEAGRPPD